MRNVCLLLSCILLSTSAVQAVNREYVLVHEESGKLSVEEAPDGVKEGDDLVIIVKNLIFSDDAYRKNGETIDVSNIEFSLDDFKFSRLPDADDKPLRFVLAMRDAFCDQKVTSESLPEEVRPAVLCDEGRSEESPGSDSSKAMSKAEIGNDCGYKDDDDVAILCFDEKGVLYSPERGRQKRYGQIDDNDFIRIVLIVPEGEENLFRAEVTGTIKTEEVSLLGAGGLGDLRKIASELQSLEGKSLVRVEVGTFGPFSAPSFTVTVQKKVDTDEIEELATTQFTVNPTYMAAIRLGVGNSEMRFNDYQLRQSSEDEETHITNVASEDGERRAFVNLVFYGWPWQKKFWRGRDIRKIPSIFERVNPLVGVGLEEIGDEYLVGISIELSRALDLFVARQYAKVKKLGGGFEEDDVFAGELADLPIVEGSEEAWIFGVAVDLRVATQVLGSLLSED